MVGWDLHDFVVERLEDILIVFIIAEVGNYPSRQEHLIRPVDLSVARLVVKRGVRVKLVNWLLVEEYNL